MPYQIGSYKGSPTITLKDNATDEKGFCFGGKKARQVAANVIAVLEFAGVSLSPACAQELRRVEVSMIPASTARQSDPMGVDRQYENDCQSRTGA